MTKQLELPKQQLKTNNTRFALALLFVAIVAVSTAGIFIRLSEREISPIAIAFNRLWIATLVFGLWNGVNSLNNQVSAHSNESEEFQTSDKVKLLLAAVVSSVALLFWNWSLAQTSVANATLLRNFTVLFTPLLGWLLLGKRYDRKFLLGMVVAMIGVMVIGLKDFQIANNNLQGDASALLSALLISVFFLIVEQLRDKLTTSTILLWRCGIGAVLILSIFLFVEDQVFPSSTMGWLIIIAQAVICQVIGQGLLVYSLKNFSSGFISIVIPLETILAASAAWAIFSEEVSVLNWLAFAVILLGINLAKSSQVAVKVVEEKG